MIVSEGAVKVGSAAGLHDAAPSDVALNAASAAVLNAGQMAELIQSTVTTKLLSPAELARAVSWRQGTLEFENQPLGNVVDEMGRYTTLQLVVSDEHTRALAIGGSFEADPQGVEALISMLEQGIGLTIRRDGDHVYIEDRAH